MASLTDDNIRTVPVFCNDANSECLVYEELKNSVLACLFVCTIGSCSTTGSISTRITR